MKRIWYCSPLFLLFYSTLIITEQLSYPLYGINLPAQARMQLISLQKKIATIHTPLHIQHAIARAQHHPIILSDLTQRRAHSTPPITWQELETTIATKPNNSFLLFGFGSLIHTTHAINAPCQPNLNIPAVVFGVKRIYNMTHINPCQSSIGLPTITYENECLRLGTRITNKKGHCANGILLQFALNTPAYMHLKKREQKYLLQPVKAIAYQSLLYDNLRFFDAYILTKSREAIVTHLDPHILYNTIVLLGATHIEQCACDGFLPLLLDTTYLSDEKTSLRTWLAAI